jgi:kynurenine 3-monooxygenase
MLSRISIIGGGLAGSLLAVYLAKRGMKIDIYERRGDIRRYNLVGGKSINLALSARGIHALKEIGIYDEIRKITIPMYGRMIHSLDGATQLLPYGKDNSQYINSVSRAELNKKLISYAENFHNVRFHFNMICSGIDLKNRYIFFGEHPDGTGTEYDIAIATDGATSQVRMEFQKIPGFNFSQEYENYGYKELTIPPDEYGKHKMEPNALHIWPRGSFMLIALPNLDGSFTCTLFLANHKSFGGENSFEELDNESKLKNFFLKNFPDAVPLMPGFVEEFFANPLGTLLTIKCYPWSAYGHTLLLGDSAHAIVPFFGQGMNAAFEDCTVLNECIGKYEYNWEVIFNEFQKIRKPNTDAIAELARENFVEMRDRVADLRFHLMKKIEAFLYSRYPDRFVPKYTMVTFLRIPYSVALERGNIQEKILLQLSESVTSPDEIDMNLADELVNEKLTVLDYREES